LPKYKTAVFINGCFWHGHEGCKYFVPPKTNTEFWYAKFKYNQERDERNYQKLRDLGWRILIVWECEIRHGNKEKVLKKLIEDIKESEDEFTK
jgi:DNA mismatch endonuclease (patch repair protein)